MGLQDFKRKRKETRTFKKIVAKRTLAEKRRAFEKESFQVARERGAELARKPTFGSRVTTFAKRAAAPRRPAPVRRSPVRRRVVRKAPVKRRSPTKRRTVRRSPVRRRTVKRVQPKQQEEIKQFGASDLFNLGS